MITYQIVGSNGKALRQISHRAPLTLAEIALSLAPRRRKRK
ncbi:MAG: hypothetical protein PW734_03360 [Verrucomicrobium sp.]|nr:hypothetical protein [Verrucomicrobium sp.]